MVRLGFNQDINDTTPQHRNLGVRIADALHTKTKEKFIKANLFFNEGDKVYPYLLADNERHLRSLIFMQDARIALTKTNIENAVDNCLSIAQNLSQSWVTAEYERKQRMQSMVFPGGLLYNKQNGVVRTPRVN